MLLICIYFLLPFSPFLSLVIADICSRLLLIFLPNILNSYQKHSICYSKIDIPYLAGLETKESRQLTISSFLNSSSLYLLPVAYTFLDSDKNELGLFFLAQRLWSGASTIIGKAYGSLVISDVATHNLEKYKIDSIVLKSISISLLLSIPLALVLFVLSYESRPDIFDLYISSTFLFIKVSFCTNFANYKLIG